MEVKNYSLLEKSIIKLFNESKEKNEFIYYQNKKYYIKNVGKPFPQKGGGECKTDVYILCHDEKQNEKEFKISIKDYSSSYVGSYINPKTAEQIFGEGWNTIIQEATESLKEEFINTPLIYKEGKIKESITVGWRLDIEFDKGSGRKLSFPLDLHEKVMRDSLYKGIYQDNYKKDARVNGEVIKNSGIAEYILHTTIGEFQTLNEIMKEIIPIDNVKLEKLRMAFKALNYKVDKKKSSNGCRPLAVTIDWNNVKDKMIPTYIFEHPLENKGKESVKKLKSFLASHNINSVGDEGFDYLLFKMQEQCNV